MSPAPRVHHTALICRDIERSLRFYRDGLGMDLLREVQSHSSWASLFGREKDLHLSFLGSSDDESSGIVELVELEGGAEPAPDLRPPAYGFFLLQMNLDVEAALERLAAMGVEPENRSAFTGRDGGSIPVVTVRDPDGVLIELTGIQD